MGLDKMEWNMSWFRRKVGYDVGGEVGGIGVDEAPFANEVKGE